MPPKLKHLMKYKEHRIKTFNDTIKVPRTKKNVKWQDNNDSSLIEALAECGFYYTPVKANLHQITCSYCHEVETVEQPLDIKMLLSNHYQGNRKCSSAMILLAQVENNSLSSRDESYLFWSNHDVNAIKDPLSHEGKELRLGFFHDFPLDTISGYRSSSVYLSECGFVYSPIFKNDDRVICFYCNCSLEGWEKDDDPMEEHENNHSQYCYFLECMKASRVSMAVDVDVDAKLDDVEHEDINEESIEKSIEEAKLESASPPKSSVIYISDHLTDDEMQIENQSSSASDDAYIGPEKESEVSGKPIRKSTRLRNKPVRKDPNDAYWNKIPDRSLYDEFMGRTSQENGSNADKSSDFDFFDSSMKNETEDVESDYNSSLVSISSNEGNNNKGVKNQAQREKVGAQGNNKTNSKRKNNKRQILDETSIPHNTNETENDTKKTSKKKLKVFNKAFSRSPTSNENVNQSFDDYDERNVNALENNIFKVNDYPVPESGTSPSTQSPAKRSISPIKIDLSTSNGTRKLRNTKIRRRPNKSRANILDHSFEDDLSLIIKEPEVEQKLDLENALPDVGMDVSNTKSPADIEDDGIDRNSADEEDDDSEKLQENDYEYHSQSNDKAHVSDEIKPNGDENQENRNDVQEIIEGSNVVNVVHDIARSETIALPDNKDYEKDQIVSGGIASTNEGVDQGNDVKDDVDVAMEEFESSSARSSIYLSKHSQELIPDKHSPIQSTDNQEHKSEASKNDDENLASVGSSPKLAESDLENLQAVDEDFEKGKSKTSKIEFLKSSQLGSVYNDYVDDIKRINEELSKSLELLSGDEKIDSNEEAIVTRDLDMAEGDESTKLDELDEELLSLADPQSAEMDLPRESPQDTEKQNEGTFVVGKKEHENVVNGDENDNKAVSSPKSEDIEDRSPNAKTLNSVPNENHLDVSHQKFEESVKDNSGGTTSLSESPPIPVDRNQLKSPSETVKQSSRISDSDGVEVLHLSDRHVEATDTNHADDKVIESQVSPAKKGSISPKKSTPMLVIDHNSEPVDNDLILGDYDVTRWSEQLPNLSNENTNHTAASPNLAPSSDPYDPHEEETALQEHSTRFSGNFSGVIESSTPQKITQASSLLSPAKPQWQAVTLTSALDTIHNLEDTATYLRGLCLHQHDLNNDYDNELTTFISAMPEEEENMTIHEWIRYSASNSSKLVRESCQEMIDIYQKNYYSALHLLETLPTED